VASPDRRCPTLGLLPCILALRSTIFQDHRNILVTLRSARSHVEGPAAKAVGACVQHYQCEITRPCGARWMSWHRQVNCLFDVSAPVRTPSPRDTGHDPSGTYSCPRRCSLGGSLTPRGRYRWDASQMATWPSWLQEPSPHGRTGRTAITVL